VQTPMTITRKLGFGGLALIAAFGATSMDAVSGAHLALAQTSPSLKDALQGEAKEHFEAGSKAYKARNWIVAEKLFLQAYSESNNPRVLYNIAVCQKEQGQFARAVGTLRQVPLAGELQDAAFLMRVSDSIGALQKETAELRLSVFQEGTAVKVDGQPAVVSNQASIFLVDAGTHKITIERKGYRAASVERTFARGEPQDVDGTLQRMEVPVHLTIGDNQNGKLFIDGEDRGSLPWAGLLPTGMHAFRVEAKGYKPETKELDLNESGVDMNFVLKSIEPLATLRVSCDRPDCSIFLDDKLVGTGSFSGRIRTGEKRLRFSAPDFDSKLVEVALREGESRDLQVSLQGKKSGISPWVWIVSGAVVAAGATTTGVILATRSTTYSGAAPGTIAPNFIAAGRKPF
jgi:hypothetical protein